MTKNSKIRVWAILGGPNAGKGTIVRHLASHYEKVNGVIQLRRRRAPDYANILLRGGGTLKVLVRVQSLQEGGITSKNFADDVVDKLRRLAAAQPAISLAWFNVLVTLRVDQVKNRKNCPPAHRYLSYFVDQGWIIESLVLLLPESDNLNAVPLYTRFGAPIATIYDSQEHLLNQKHSPLSVQSLVGHVRNHFDWA
jgi:hypothetical protein